MTKLYFEVQDAEMLEDDPTSQFASCRIQLFSSGMNLHNMTCPEDVLEKTASSIYNKPILYEINNIFDDFGTHNDSPLIAGFVVPDSAEFKRLPDSRLSLFVDGKIWKRYAPQAMDFFKRDSGYKKTSVEMELYAHDKNSDGVDTMNDFSYTGVSILGDRVKEASPGSHMEMLSFSDEKKLYSEAYMKEFASKYDNLDLSIPKTVKDNAIKALELYKKGNARVSSISLSTARYLSKNSHITMEKLEHFKKYSPKFNSDISKKDDNYVSWMCWGGREGQDWIGSIFDKVDEIDKKRLAYFAVEGGNMPYKSLKEINPALKSLDGISLSQANAIAKQADAIGETKDKSGWAIAIANFKKTHIHKDGHWVEKEKESMAQEEFAKTELGKSGKALKVNKSKEAMVDSSWGDVNKTTLMHQVLEASNYKSLVNSVYLLVDGGWEDHPSQSLHYPVMQLKGDTFVYNRYGLSAALQRAKGQNESGVVSKLNGLYKKLGLGSDNEDSKTKKMASASEKFSMASNEILQLLSNSVSQYVYGQNNYRKYWVNAFDDIYAYFTDEETGIAYRAKFTLIDNKANIDLDGKEEVINTFEPTGKGGEKANMAKEDEEDKKPEPKDNEENMAAEENKPEPKDDEEDDDKKGKFSLASFIDVAALLDLLEDETDQNREDADDLEEAYQLDVNMAKEEAKKEFSDTDGAGKVMKGMMAKMARMSKSMAKMASDNKTYMEKMAELEKYKADQEKSQKQFAVDGVIAELKANFEITDDLEKELRTEAEKFSLENISGWQNICKAKTFDFAVSASGKGEAFKKIGIIPAKMVTSKVDSPYPAEMNKE